MRTLNRRAVAVVAAGLLALGVTACDDTEEGLEEDAEELGDDVEEGADDLENEVEED